MEKYDINNISSSNNVFDYWLLILIEGRALVCPCSPFTKLFLQIPKGTGEWSPITMSQKSPLPAEIYFDASCFILKIHMNFEFYFIVYWYLFIYLIF